MIGWVNSTSKSLSINGLRLVWLTNIGKRPAPLSSSSADLQVRRFTRLTNGFSKKWEYHLYAVALHVLWVNYCRPHTTLTKAAKGAKTTPAMAAGLTDRVWTAVDILALLDGR